MRTRLHRRRGFTLIDIMISLALLAIMAALAGTELYSRTLVARRTEAILGLSNLWKAQQTYYAAKGVYSEDFRELDFQIEGGTLLGPDSYRGKMYTYQLSRPWGEGSFYCIASADLDGDAWPDILEIFEGSP